MFRKESEFEKAKRKSTQKAKSTRFLKLRYSVFYNYLTKKVVKDINETGLDLDGDICIGITRFTKKQVVLFVDMIRHKYTIFPIEVNGKLKICK